MKAAAARPASHIGLHACATPMANEHRAGGVVYRKALRDDDTRLRQLLRDNTMQSWVRISFEREPSYFAGENLLGESTAVIAHEQDLPDRTVGAYSFQLLPVHVNGVAQRAGYLAGLRVNWPYRHRLRILRNGYASIRALAGPDAVPLWFTSVASDNAPARRLLEAGLAGMPVYRPVGELHTLAMATCRGRARGLLRRAQRRDAAALAEFFNRRATAYQFSPVLTEDWLLSLSGHNGLRLDDFWLLWDGQRLRGCLAIWDQREFKQAVARGYRFPLNALRSSYDLWAALTRRVQLPRPGQKLEQVFLPFVAFDEGVGGAAPDAVGEGLALARDKDARAGVLGLSSENPLAAALKDAFNAHVYRTCIETVGWQDAPGTALDGRPPQPEVALL